MTATCWQCGKIAKHEFNYGDGGPTRNWCGDRVCGPVSMWSVPYGTMIRPIDSRPDNAAPDELSRLRAALAEVTREWDAALRDVDARQAMLELQQRLFENLTKVHDAVVVERDDLAKWKAAAMKAFPGGFTCVRILSHLRDDCEQAGFALGVRCPQCSLNELIFAEVEALATHGKGDGNG